MTEVEKMESENAALRAIHQSVLPGFIAAARAGYSAKQMLAYINQCREGMTICAAFNLIGDDLADALTIELE